MSASEMNGSLNLASLPPAERMLIEADKTACLIRWKCAGLTGPERQMKGQELLLTVDANVRAAVVARLKARGSK